MLATVFIVAALLTGDQVAVTASTTPPAEARPTDAPAGPEGDTRRVCRLERATGSNLQQRVCRDIPRAPAAQDQQAREFMSAMQRVKIPDSFNIPQPGIGGVSRCGGAPC